MAETFYVLDTTVLIDLYGAERIHDVFGVRQAKFALTLRVFGEFKHYFDKDKKKIDVRPEEKTQLLEKYAVSKLHLELNEVDDFNALHELTGEYRLGPGESEAAAISVSRGHTFVTDDLEARKKIKNYFSARVSDPRIIGLKVALHGWVLM